MPFDLRKLFSWYKTESSPGAEADTTFEHSAGEIIRTQNELLNQLSALHNAALVSETNLLGDIIFANDTFCELSKYSRSELLAQNHRILKSGKQPDSLFVELWQTISRGQVWRGEVCNRAKDGSFYWVYATITPALDETGKPYKYISVRFELTQQKLQEQNLAEFNEELLAQEEELRQTLEELQATNNQLHTHQLELQGYIQALNRAAIVSTTNLAGDITFVNETFCAISKYAYEELIGQNHRMLKSGKQPDSLFVELWRSISSGSYFQGEICNRAKDGSFYWVHATITPILGPDGKPARYISIRFDITRLKEYEVQLSQQLEEITVQQEERLAYLEKVQGLNSELTEAKHRLEQLASTQADRLRESIAYAQRIQRAMITPLQQLQAMVPAPFSVEVLYRPKDLVGGDFYWAGSWKNKTVLALGDGSGHGVPGAFMCTVGISLIAKLVEDRGITEPASLLDELDTEVKNLLNQENELTERVEESLEASVLTFMPGKTQVAFAAALRPALLVRRGEVVVFGADRRPVGGTLHDPKPFTHQLIDFEPGDTLYLFSDGFAHQMGGPSPEGKKFGMAAFRELLQKAAQLGSLQEQVRLLTTTLEDWQDGKHPQTDDVIVVIVRCQAASS